MKIHELYVINVLILKFFELNRYIGQVKSHM